jgi:hypothetical protein
MKVVLTLMIILTAFEAHAIDFNSEINQAANEEYDTNQKVIALSGSSEVIQDFEVTYKKPETPSERKANFQFMKLRAKKTKIASR